jgi:L-aspartate oxidase
MRTLGSAVRRAGHVHVFEHTYVDALLRTRDRVGGVRARCDDATFALAAPAVVLATGGLGALYRHTTNPATADASGLALAPEAGASGQLPLLTEALRGAGAVLVNGAGQRFLCGVSAHAELAPRDVVARAVWSELQRGQDVFLDATRAVGDAFARRFPTVHAICVARGLDPARTPIPVVPAQHYHMGGIRVDARGRSSIGGLYAVGEAACSGVHGANRLASNSLLEGVVFGRALGDALAQDDGIVSRPTIIDSGPVVIDAPPAAEAAALADILWQYCGLVRDDRGLGQALAELDALDRRIPPAARARVAVARRIVLAARARRDSLGAHWRADGACARAG